ncbi:MAG TPA: DUF4421 family protein [Chryseosolibacter sp.]|nr:DUF4421 family protein [Chryseosolibacter sp.]
MRFLALTLLCVCACESLAQQVETTVPAEDPQDSVRHYYIKDFPDHYFLYPVLKQRSLNFELEKESGDPGVVTFKPNNTFSFGLGLYLFEVGFELAFAIPLEEKSIDLYGESAARDVQLNLLGKKWGLDAFYQRYKGFYVTDSRVDVPSGTPYPQRPDVSTRNVGLTGSYVFNHQRFSFRSAYNFSERQVFSKGSVIVLSSINGFRLNADSSILNTSQRENFGEDIAFTNLKFTSFSIAPGYTYSLVFQSFFLNAALAVGPAQHWILYKPELSGQKQTHELNSFIAARISLGYNGERLFGGVSFVSQGSNVQFGDARFSNNNGAFKILIGYRFRESGILKKRVWDYVPLSF